MEVTLILAEKREAAERIAEALDQSGSPKMHRLDGVPYFEVLRMGQILRVVPAIGHLYTIAPKGKGQGHLVADVEWVPAYMFNKQLIHTRRWIDAIRKNSQDASSFISATDYDMEGEVIGYTILRFACGGKEKEAKRMIFSTLTKAELQRAFQNVSPTLDFELAKAGETRHIIDFLWGINVSRALTRSLRNSGVGFTRLSAGRVQGPTLGFVAEREKEINSFVPTPYWRISALLEVRGETYRVEYRKPRVETLEEARRVIENCKSREGVVKSIASRIVEESSPPPFNLENLQLESYRVFKQTPSQTLHVAEALYLGALISYPRTSSEKIPPTVNSREILTSLGQLSEYRDLVLELFREGRLHPRQGIRDDPAHPAIYPTGSQARSRLDRRHAALLDLIVRRFLSSFASPAKTESVRVAFDVNGEVFFLIGNRTLKEGWLRFYEPYTRWRENPAPALTEGEQVKFKEIVCDESFTLPPPRFNPGSLLRMMEEQELGTKATRAETIETLRRRGYVSGERMLVTELGLGIYETLCEYSPALVSVELTRDLESDVEAVRKGEIDENEVVKEATRLLTGVVEAFKTNETAIGERLSQALRSKDSRERMIGPCPVCGVGQLQIITSRVTGKRFAGCSNYRTGGCRASFPLPQTPYRIWTTRKACGVCGWPTLTVKPPNRREAWSLCLNPNCQTKTGSVQA